MLVNKVGVEDASTRVDGGRSGDDNIFPFFILQYDAEQSHYRLLKQYNQI